MAFLFPVQSSVYADANAEADVAEADTTAIGTSIEQKNIQTSIQLDLMTGCHRIARSG